ncbi:hypothetical protein QFC24_004103 [Naganishia onofrii]|uniref:Uncharacterized protein n=1 Tax=Naganishia onofrii TaxID=1851511 RepID=A0ACC2XGX0_9TREE|nr:hypothetical protein QFC24_004103 [Naganishia onofrii]
MVVVDNTSYAEARKTDPVDLVPTDVTHQKIEKDIVVTSITDNVDAEEEKANFDDPLLTDNASKQAQEVVCSVAEEQVPHAVDTTSTELAPATEQTLTSHDATSCAIMTPNEEDVPVDACVTGSMRRAEEHAEDCTNTLSTYGTSETAFTKSPASNPAEEEICPVVDEKAQHAVDLTAPELVSKDLRRHI